MLKQVVYVGMGTFLGLSAFLTLGNETSAKVDSVNVESSTSSRDEYDLRKHESDLRSSGDMDIYDLDSEGLDPEFGPSRPGRSRGGSELSVNTEFSLNNESYHINSEALERMAKNTVSHSGDPTERPQRTQSTTPPSESTERDEVEDRDIVDVDSEVKVDEVEDDDVIGVTEIPGRG